MMADKKTDSILDQDDAMESYFVGLLSTLDPEHENELSANEVKLVSTSSSAKEELPTDWEADVDEAERLEEEKAEAERLKTEVARLKAQQAEAARLEAEQTEAERLVAEQAEAARRAAEQAEAERLATEQAEAARLAAEQVELEQRREEQAETERLIAEHAEIERLKEEQAEAERLIAEQAEAVRLEVEQTEAERLAAEQAETEKLKEEQVKARRLAEQQTETTHDEATLVNIDSLAPSWVTHQLTAVVGSVNNVNLAFPSSAINGELEFSNDLKNVKGQPDWVLGLKVSDNDFIAVIDAGKLMLDQPVRDIYKNPYKKIILLNGSKWGIALDSISTELNINSSDIKWRKSASERPWLCGFISEQQLAVVDPNKIFAATK